MTKLHPDDVERFFKNISNLEPEEEIFMAMLLSRFDAETATASKGFLAFCHKHKAIDIHSDLAKAATPKT